MAGTANKKPRTDSSQQPSDVLQQRGSNSMKDCLNEFPAWPPRQRISCMFLTAGITHILYIPMVYQTRSLDGNSGSRKGEAHKKLVHGDAWKGSTCSLLELPRGLLLYSRSDIKICNKFCTVFASTSYSKSVCGM